MCDVVTTFVVFTVVEFIIYPQGTINKYIISLRYHSMEKKKVYKTNSVKKFVCQLVY